MTGMPFEGAEAIGAATASAFALVAASVRWWERRHAPIDRADEAYLWYGARLVTRGAVPVRDFRSYEPGRYWWCAAVLALLGDGMTRLRLAAHALWAAVLAALAFTMALSGHSYLAIGTLTVVLVLWGWPQYKLFEPATQLAGVVAGAAMLAWDAPFAPGGAGVVAGLATIMGVNLGAYLAVALGALSLLAPGDGAVAAYAAGLLLGWAPLVLWATRTPGVARSLWERRVRQVVSRGSTNLPTPVPWPWRRGMEGLWGWSTGPRRVVQWAFVVLPTVQLVSVLVVILDRELRADAPVFAASAFVGVVVLHHAFSRADPTHIALVIGPTAVTLVSVLDRLPGPLAVTGYAGIVAASAVAASGWRGWERRPTVWVMAADETTAIPMVPEDAMLVSAVRALLIGADPAAPVLAVPTSLGLLVALDRASAVYDVFSVYPADAADEQRMLGELERTRPPIAVVDLQALDGREDLRFCATHPRVWAWLSANYERVEAPGVHGEVHVLVPHGRRQAQAGATAPTN